MKICKTYCDNINETLYETTLASGLKVCVMPKKDYYKTYAIIATRFGSADDAFITNNVKEEMPDGVAHFLEHKLFEQKDGNAFEKYAKTGASANAFTSFHTTAYLFSCTDKFKENLKILLDFVQNPYFTDENVSKEQGIIGQEIDMYRDDPNWRVFFNLIAALYKDNPIRKDIAGTSESISKITPELLYRIYNIYYQPSNMVFFVAGDVVPEDVMKLADELIIAKKTKIDIERLSAYESSGVCRKYTEQRLSVSKPLFQLGFKDAGKPVAGYDLLKKEIVNSIAMEAVFGRSSRFYEHLYKEGLIDDSFELDQTIEPEYAFSVIGGESSNPKKVSEYVLGEIQRINACGINISDFKRSKKVLYGDHIRLFNNVERIAHSFITCMFKDISLLDFTKAYNEITYEDVMSRFTTHFSQQNMALSVVLPNDKEE